MTQTDAAGGGPRVWEPTGAAGAARLCAVIGAPVAHSLSPVLHRAAYEALGLTDWSYGLAEVTPEQLPEVLTAMASAVTPGSGTPVGLSVTMPHKQAVIPLLDAVDPLAAVTGAVNTVVAQRSGRGAALLTGFNTDVAGISQAIQETAPVLAPGAGAVVLGAGATACSALAALTELGASSITVAARRLAGPGRVLSAAHRMGLEVGTLSWQPGEEASDLVVAEALRGAELVVSTLPAGAAETVAAQLAGGRGLRPGAVLLDVVYAPWPTALTAAWQVHGGTCVPGWLMLLHQAAAQVHLMTGREAPVDAMRSALMRALAERP
ncbi:shikimate dehydrogenase [Actinomyces trachealis]|uniref:shikimate dehydrogenase n=1 Tax=Actinomyces trachealis TaxID=2763540 RepID=UPI0018C765B7|nr:shikimate dehydrogenase [Actinomyces trachealis]